MAATNRPTANSPAAAAPEAAREVDVSAFGDPTRTRTRGRQAADGEGDRPLRARRVLALGLVRRHAVGNGRPGAELFVAFGRVRARPVLLLAAGGGRPAAAGRSRPAPVRAAPERDAAARGVEAAARRRPGRAGAADHPVRLVGIARLARASGGGQRPRAGRALREAWPADAGRCPGERGAGRPRWRVPLGTAHEHAGHRGTGLAALPRPDALILGGAS